MKMIVLLILSLVACVPAPKTLLDNLPTTITKTSEPLVNGCDCGATTSQTACYGNTISYVAGPSTIKFDFRCDGGACRCGKYANGHDYWIAPKTDNGNVEIIGMTPASFGTPGTADYRNGWVVNPSSMSKVGLDGRFYSGGNHQTPQNPTASSPYLIETSKGIQSIWKADHYPDADVGTSCNTIAANGDTRMCFLQTSLLTVVPTVPENAGTTSLRPPYFGTNKKSYSVNDIDFTIFPSLPQITRPGGDVVTLNWDKSLADLAFPDADWGRNYSATQVHHAKYNWNTPMTNGYPAYQPLQNKYNALALLPYEATGENSAKKRLLIIRAIQQGIDTLQTIEYGDVLTVDGVLRGGYAPNGGHHIGRYVQTLIAAAALEKKDPALKSLLISLKNSEVGRYTFPEMSQFTYNQATGRYTYGTYNVISNLFYFIECHPSLPVGTKCQENSILADPQGNYDHAPEGITDIYYANQGSYQAIVWNATFFAATMGRAIPALRPLIYEGTNIYVNRMVREGTYTNVAAGILPVKPLAYCKEGLNINRVCGNSTNCGGKECLNRNTNFTNYIWTAVNLWQEYDHCLDAKSCLGM